MNTHFQKAFIWFMVVAAFPACEKSKAAPGNYANTIKQGIAQSRIASAVNKKFPGAKNYVTHINSIEPKPLWNTKFVICRRYIVHYQEEVVVDASGSPVFQSNPMIQIREIIRLDRMENGRWKALYGFSKDIPLAEWDRFTAGGWDVSTLVPGGATETPIIPEGEDWSIF